MSEVRRSTWKNGRFRAKAIIVRQINDIEIVFYNHESIYVKDEHGTWVVFHRWEAGLGSYSDWRRFRTMLLYEKTINFAHCHRLAFRYDIPSQASRAPDLKGKTVEVISGGGRTKIKNKEKRHGQI